jgi:hypothetical protein
MPSFTFTFNDDSVEKEKPSLWSNSKKISFEDYLELTALVFDWGDSYDAKVLRKPSIISLLINNNNRTGPVSAKSSHQPSSSTTPKLGSLAGNP